MCSSFFLWIRECLIIEGLQGFIHGNKELAGLALETLVECQHGSHREILLDEYQVSNTGTHIRRKEVIMSILQMEVQREAEVLCPSS